MLDIYPACKVAKSENITRHRLAKAWSCHVIASRRSLSCMLPHEGSDQATAGSTANTGAWDDDADEAGATGGELPDIVELRRDEMVRWLP